jgi:rSAM/selenodomain-associated transferase 2
LVVSVVIPVLHDTEALTRMLDATDFGDAQVIVAATPDDRTSLAALRAARPGVRWVETERGRARQMNAGAACAQGRWLIFLHADTHLPLEWRRAIEGADSDPRADAGCFRFALDSVSAAARVIELGVRLRVRVFSLPYGDQAIFVRRDRFQAIGGYADVPIMEDVDLVRRLGRGRRRGWLFRAAELAVTSARRWERDGWIRRTSRHVFMILLYFAGIPPKRLLSLDPARRDHPNPSGQRMSV